MVGPETLARLKEAAGAEAAAKLDRAPTLVVASVVERGDPVQDEEDHAAAAAGRTSSCSQPTRAASPATGARRRFCALPAGAPAVGVPEGERAIGLLHLGPPRQEEEPPERLPPGDFVTYLP